MTTADQLHIVDQKLTELLLASAEKPNLTSGLAQMTLINPKTGFSSVKATCLADGGLVSGWVKSRRLCVIVEERSRSPNTQALLIFNSTSFPVSKPQDLTLDSVLPVDAEFK